MQIRSVTGEGQLALPLTVWSRCCLALALAGLSPWTLAQVPEHQLKAAIVFKLMKFVSWPEQAFKSSAGTFAICLLGRDDFAPALTALNGKSIHGRQVIVRRLVADGSQLLASECQLVFLGSSDRGELHRSIAKVEGGPLLTVSDQPGFAEAGGMVNLATVGNKIRFEVNLRAVNRARLKISAQLLRLATIVKGNG